jgi:hypothetical protein
LRGYIFVDSRIGFRINGWMIRATLREPSREELIAPIAAKADGSMSGQTESPIPVGETIDYEQTVQQFNQALIHTLRNHSVGGSFLDLWVPDADPILGITSMVDSARIFGIPEITIRFRAATVHRGRLQELEQKLTGVGKISLEVQDGAILLRVADMREDLCSVRSGPEEGPAPGAYWRAEIAFRLDPLGSPPLVQWTDSSLPDFIDVNPLFRAELKTAFEALCREDHPNLAEGQLICITANEPPTTLTFGIDPSTHRVVIARHSGAKKPSERAILDLFCRASETHPIQEVADHVGLRVLDTLASTCKSPPVSGVLLPINAGAPFLLPARLARQAYDKYRRKVGIADGANFCYDPPSQQWQAASEEQRLRKLFLILAEFIPSHMLLADDLTILGIGNNRYDFPVRVTVAFSDRVRPGDRPRLMRQLEHWIRQRLEPALEILADRARDKSPLRRLS